jgi:RNA polymerase sigma factor (sigma-70 family)
MTKGNASVWVVSDDERLKAAITFVLTEASIPCSAFTSSQHALEMTCVASPPCLVVDNELNGLSGMDLVAQFHSQHGTFPFVLITRKGTVDLAVEAMKKGAMNVLEVPVDNPGLVDAVKSGLQLDSDKRLREILRTQFVNRFQSLTAREREIAELVFDGKLSKQIAKLLSISPKTVEVHRSRITKKLEVKSVAQLVKLMQLTRT